jgi:2-polyprenyl-6-methoxyphenol hydroxylase-like FAD-dependent oxidoreductase
MPFDVTRAYDEATQYRDPRIWTAERDIEMWKRWRAEVGAVDYQQVEFATAADRQSWPTTATPPGRRPAPPGGGGRCRPGGADAGDRPRAARAARAAAGQRPQAVHRLARHLLCQAHAGDLGPPGRGPAHGRQGRVVERGPRLLRRARRSTASTCCPSPGHERPAFINLQQYYAEAYLVERARALPNLDPLLEQPRHGVGRRRRRVTLTVDTPDGPTRCDADHVAACDGSRSPLRALLGLESKGQVFQDRFLIADVNLPGRFPDATERWFWFDPPFHRGQSVLLHKQPDNVWRIDFQLGWDADPDSRSSPSASPRVCRRCCARARARGALRRWNGSASTPSPACAWTASATAA